MTDPVVQQGSLIFCHSPDFVGFLIRVSEKLRWRGGSSWNHVAVALETAANPLVVQATASGVTDVQRLSDLEGGPVHIVPPPRGVNGKKVALFAQCQVGDSYGYFTLLGVACNLLMPRWFRFRIGRDGGWICSALSAEALRYGGWYAEWPDIYSVSPAQLAIALQVPETLVYPKRIPRTT